MQFQQPMQQQSQEQQQQQSQEQQFQDLKDDFAEERREVHELEATRELPDAVDQQPEQQQIFVPGQNQDDDVRQKVVSAGNRFVPDEQNKHPLLGGEPHKKASELGADHQQPPLANAEDVAHVDVGAAGPAGSIPLEVAERAHRDPEPLVPAPEGAVDEYGYPVQVSPMGPKCHHRMHKV